MAPSTATAAGPRTRAITGAAARTTAQAAAALVLLAGSGAASAQFQGGQDDDRGIVRGPFTLLPELSGTLRHDDNIYQSDDFQKESAVALLGLGLGARYETGTSGWELAYAGEAAAYEYDGDDNYFDHRLGGRGIVQMGIRHRLELSAGLDKLHEDRGSRLTQGFGEQITTRVPEPDRFDNSHAELRYRFGAPRAKGRLQLDARYSDKEYTNNRDRTRPFDRDSRYVAGTFFWRVFPNSSLLLLGSHAEVSYPVDFSGQSSRDSSTNRVLAGITWEATAKTTGTVKVGYLAKDFDAADRADFDAPSWEVELRWEPRSYSVVEFETRRFDREFNFGAGGDFIDTATYAVTWEHDWSDRWSTETGLSYVDETFEGGGAVASAANRTQETTVFDAALRFALRRTVDVELRYTLRDRDSNLSRFRFGRNQVALGLALAL